MSHWVAALPVEWKELSDWFISKRFLRLVRNIQGFTSNCISSMFLLYFHRQFDLGEVQERLSARG
jgi:hypothetical protein